MNKEKQPTAEPRFKTIEEALIDPVFIEFVGKNIDEILTRRRSRPTPKKGMRYKRDWYDRMDDKDILNADHFLKNIEAIWLKESTLNREERSLIKFVCDRSLQQTIIFYRNKEKQP